MERTAPSHSSLRHVLVVGGTLHDWSALTQETWDRRVEALGGLCARIGVPWLTYIMVAAGLTIIYLFPFVTKSIPSLLVCIVALTAVTLFFGFDLPPSATWANCPRRCRFFSFPTFR